MIAAASCYMYVLDVLTTAANQTRLSRTINPSPSPAVFVVRTLLNFKPEHDLLPFLTKWSSAPKPNHTVTATLKH